MAPDRSQEREPALLGCVDERAHQKDSPERAPELQILDPRKHRLGALDELEHLGVEVDRDNSTSKR